MKRTAYLSEDKRVEKTQKGKVPSDRDAGLLILDAVSMVTLVDLSDAALLQGSRRAVDLRINHTLGPVQADSKGSWLVDLQTRLLLHTHTLSSVRRSTMVLHTHILSSARRSDVVISTYLEAASKAKEEGCGSATLCSSQRNEL